MKITIECEIKCPSVPNFIRIETDQINKDNERTVSISELTEEQLQKVGEIWTIQLIQNARKKRKLKEDLNE